MKVLVIGASLSGSAVSKLLVQKGYEVYLTDANEIKDKKALEALGIHVYDGGHPEVLKTYQYAFVVKNPGIPYTVPFVKYFQDLQVSIYNEIEVASRFVKQYQYGAITGTNGKTTTTQLLSELLKLKNPINQAAGNIGLPLSEIVLKYQDQPLDIALEIAAFQLLGIETFKPKVSVITNLTPDHLDYFTNVDAYYKAKTLVYKYQDEQDYFLLNLDDEQVVNYVKDIKAQVITYSTVQKADVYIQEDKVYYRDVMLFDLGDLRLVGMHNVSNAMVASMMAYLMGVSLEDIRTGIQAFKGVEHRIEFVATINDIRYYNDSKGTNTDATIVALKAFKDPVILLAGGYDKKTGFHDMIPYLNKVKDMIVFGAVKEQLKAIYPKAYVVDTMFEAIDVAKKIASKNDVVLLSPMCASYDQFRNFEQRGQLFKEYILKDLGK
ncbi:UDP-N-acetylmuramoyl-L-alanine--D-glutamate ligase [Erysipelotrichaceae bacterium OH741_COT-311]|nr:UDP-N-acetylmuramoyl-L-alanine--D-glutamate ligase [Erysipelotrichaceae bacterium OH741_COT-311]